MEEFLGIYKSEINSVDENYNGGKISNYRYYLNFPLQFFNGTIQENLPLKPYIYRKFFIRNKLSTDVHNLRFYLLPSKFNYDIEHENYQFYLTPYTNENDVEIDLNIQQSKGLIKLWKNIPYKSTSIYLRPPNRQNNIKISSNLKENPIIFYKKSTNEILEENKIIDIIPVSFNGEEFYYCELKFPVKNNYNIYKHYISVGIEYEKLKIERYIPIWIGFEFYNFVNNYLYECNLIISYNIEIIEVF